MRLKVWDFCTFNLSLKKLEKERFKNEPTLEKKIDKKDDEIEELKEEIRSLKHSLDYLKDKFVNLIKLIKNRIFSKRETREKYMDFSRDLYAHGVLEDKEMFSIKDDYYYCKNHDNDKEKDDYDISI